jgi:hypothetical protein
MRRVAIAALLAVWALDCNWLDQSRAKSTASRLESKHLAEVRRVADDLEKSCIRPAGGSSVAGTSLDRDPAVAEVEVRCSAAMHGTTRLRATKWTLNDSYFAIGIGKDADAGTGADAAEESVTVPSSIAPKANDLCIRRPAVEICVAYRD